MFTDTQSYIQHLASISSMREFNELALALFRYQAKYCSVYNQFIQELGIHPTKIQAIEEIPFLPIEVFKSHEVQTDHFEAQAIFTSSGTSGMSTSQHFVRDLSLYEWSFFQAFEQAYHKHSTWDDWCILALLPSYMERSGSSLIYMAEKMVDLTQRNGSGFYLNADEALFAAIDQAKSKGKKALLLGVTFALLAIAERQQVDFDGVVVMETGGMKGMRKEMVREELHGFLQSRMNVSAIHSEYGMTELLSQAYSKGQGIFEAPPWMRVMIRQVDDPFGWETHRKTGGVNVIDLASRDSCAFIATSDLGRVSSDGSFEILGRFDHADVRGCNLLLA
ncbi:MAG: acyl transferase [Flavobacteriales bacterium]|nr:acyl transferase [Flavobacteriales bacterium]